jgi:hypothetical protein
VVPFSLMSKNTCSSNSRFLQFIITVVTQGPPLVCKYKLQQIAVVYYMRNIIVPAVGFCNCCVWVSRDDVTGGDAKVVYGWVYSYRSVILSARGYVTDLNASNLNR